MLGAVVATDSVSVNADHDNGFAAVHDPPRPDGQAKIMLVVARRRWHWGWVERGGQRTPHVVDRKLLGPQVLLMTRI
jgi:hypothetical protein